MDSLLTLEDSIIDENTAPDTPAISALKSNLDMKNNTFQNHDCEKACFLEILTDSKLTDNSSSFINANAKQEGAI